jgi:NitT/TauT family transport system substrate-binding protein
VGAARRISTSSLHLAEELGYFREAGFDVEILQGGTPLSAVALLAGGKLDVHFGGCNILFLNAVIRGLRLRIVAGRQIASASCGDVGAIYGLRRTFPHGLTDLTQLRGKRVGVGLAVGIAQFALDAHLASAGLSAKDVTPVNLDFKQNVAALLGGGIDATVGNDDFERDLASMPEIVHTGGLSGIYPHFQYSYIIFGRTMLEAGLDSGTRFLSAYLRGVREFARGRTPRFLEQFATDNGLNVKRALATPRDCSASDGAIDRNSLRLLAGWAAQRGYIPRPVDVSELVDDQFLKRIHES